MTYYNAEGILIRNPEPGDVEVIVREELARGYGRFYYTSHCREA